MVFSLVHESGRILVLKKDFKPGTPWIEREFRRFEQLRPHFAAAEGCEVVEPVYLGADKSFHITGFAKGRTASDVLRNPQSQAQADQVFRRSGRWLNHLHKFGPAEPGQIWMNWIFEEFDKLRAGEDVHAQPEHYAAFLEQLRSQSHQFQGSPCSSVFSHGDFHSGNLILGKGSVCGLDLAYSETKPAIYDVVDFLASDMDNPLPADGIGPGGVRQSSVEFFFKTYRRPVSRPLLNFHLRSKLLLELMKFQHSAVIRKPRIKARFENRLARLSLAFDQPLAG
ncbi:aminoglycoside phosphotransferase family protein [Leisingera thetidis]|uniref:aminoglycoside phosphotransferase family protein n=1 Tax=Leisingera thetidis TaxID=2930199 RepID=UPI0033131DF2